MAKAYDALAHVIALGTDGNALDVTQLTDRISGAIKSLDTDPHYRYELRFGAGELPALPARNWLVMSCISGDGKEGPWVIVDIFARCAQSVIERPITVSGTISAGGDPAAEADMKAFVEYGTPFNSAENATEFTVDAPGGLGVGPLKGTMSMMSLPDVGQDKDISVDILSPEGIVLATVELTRTERTTGTRGKRVVLHESHNVFTLEQQWDGDLRSLNRRLAFGSFAGQPVSAVASALSFLSNCVEPNSGRMYLRHTPPEIGVTDPSWALPMNSEFKGTLKALQHICMLLQAIQTHSRQLVRFPSSRFCTPENVHEWEIVTKLIAGNTVTMQYAEGNAVWLELESQVDTLIDGGVTLPLVATIGEVSIALGTMVATLEGAELIDCRLTNGRHMHAFTTTGRKVSYRRVTASETSGGK